jgi:hypothetical protein
MCAENKNCFIILLAALFLSSAWGVLHGQEPDSWYLISETELRSIEAYKEKSEAEKQTWLSRVRELRRDSEISNSQLSQAREANRRLEQSFNEYEADWSRRTSLKNGEIEDLRQNLANQELKTAKTAGQRNVFALTAAAMFLIWIAKVVYKALKIFRIIPV